MKDVEFNPKTALHFYLRRIKERDQVFNFDKHAIALLPYNTGMSDEMDPTLREDFYSFDGFLGDCLRAIKGKSNALVSAGALDEILASSDEDPRTTVKRKENTLVKNKRLLKDTILSKAVELTECEDGNPDKLRAIVDSIFFSGDNLLKYGSKAQLYMFRNSEDSTEEISKFMLSIFFGQEIRDLINGASDSKKHVLHHLLDQSLPELVNVPASKSKKNAYHILDEKVIALFHQDFKFLNKDRDAFLNESTLLFKFYYFFYVSRSSIILTNMFKKKDFQLYFTLENESVSESRRTFEVGWRTLEWRANKLFSHTVCLDFLNNIPMVAANGPLDYIGLTELYLTLSASDRILLCEQIESIYKFYKEYPASDVSWDGFNQFLASSKLGGGLKNELEQIVFKLFSAIDYQFEKFSRKSKRDGYGKWFTNFCKVNMLKTRGKYGYTLSLSNELLLFLTKLCIGEQERMRLKDLWSAFKERGIYFDDPTQQAIVAIYDKINLIEKKSDSGDAQYIRRIL